MLIENLFECVVPELEPIPPAYELGREEDDDLVDLSDDVDTVGDVDEEAYRDLTHNLVGVLDLCVLPC